MQLKYNFYMDPGHGWIEVRLTELVELGIVGDISSYSFVNKQGTKVYLEEDLDATTWTEAFLEKHNKKPEIEEHITNSPSFIRRLPRFRRS